MSYSTKRLAIYGIVGILGALPIIATMTLAPWTETVAKSETMVYYSPSLPSGYRIWPLNMLNLTIADFTGPRGVGSQALVTATIKSPYDILNATVKIDLLPASSDQPIGISFVEGDSMRWIVGFDEDIPVSFNAKIEAIEIGYVRVLATATWHDDLDSHIKVSDALWVSVLENDIKVSHGANLLTFPDGLEIDSHVPKFYLFEDNETVPEATADFILYPYKPYEGVLSDRWVELITSLAICAWVSLIISRITLYIHSERGVLERKRLGMLVAATIVGGVALTCASGLHQIKPVIMDAQEIYYGFPFVWFKAFRGTWMIVTPWHYKVQWFGLIGDLALYSWTVFITCSMIFYFHRKFAQPHFEMKE